MIFDERFDRALWLMLAIDKKNRDKIREFIRMIPNEMYSYLRKEINEDGFGGIVDYSKTCNFDTKRMMGNDGFRYVISSGLVCGQLQINVFRYNILGTIEESYNLFLAALNDDYFALKFDRNSREIGFFSYEICERDLCEIEDKEIFDSQRYAIKKKNFDKLYGYLENSKIKIGKKINLDDYRGEMNIEDFINEDSVNNLVRIRKR